MKNQIIQSQQDISMIKKISFLQNMIHKTVMAIQKYKILDIIGPNELNICITSCEAIFNQFNILLDTLNGKTPVNKAVISAKITELISEMIIIFKTRK